MRLSVLFLAFLLSSSPIFADEIEALKVPTGEDGDVLAKFNKSTRLPIGASDERAEVVGVHLSVFSGPNLEWTWIYSVRFNNDASPIRIRVEDESQRPNLLEVEHASPVLNDFVWVAEAPRKPFTKEVFDYMQSKGTWFYMRKFTIDYADGSKSVLHQPVLYTQATRVEIIKTLMSPKK